MSSLGAEPEACASIFSILQQKRRVWRDKITFDFNLRPNYRAMTSFKKTRQYRKLDRKKH